MLTNPGSSFAKAATCGSLEQNPDLARSLLEQGAAFVLLHFPAGSQFGVDTTAWVTDHNFKGLKMIPPGLHFLHCSAVSKEGNVAPRIGVFHHFQSKEILVKRWNPITEDIDGVSGEESDRFSASLLDLDPSLGPYPYDQYRNWFSLSNFIRPDTIERLCPLDSHGRITSQADLCSAESLSGDQQSSYHRVDRDHPIRARIRDSDGLPIMEPRPGTQIRFTTLPNRRHSLKAQGSTADKTSLGMDCSPLVEKLVTEMEGGAEGILGELQFALICFLQCGIWEAWEQWVRLLELLCGAGQSITAHPALYQQFIHLLYYQLREMPADMLVDVVSRDNFLLRALQKLFGFLRDAENVSSELHKRADNFGAFLAKRFKWNLAEEADENQPVIVDI